VHLQPFNAGSRARSSKKESSMPHVPFDGISTYQEKHTGKV